MTRLTQLELSECDITDAGIPHLKALSGLKALMLINTKVTDAGAKELKRGDCRTWSSTARGFLRAALALWFEQRVTKLLERKPAEGRQVVGSSGSIARVSSRKCPNRVGSLEDDEFIRVVASEVDTLQRWIIAHRPIGVDREDDGCAIAIEVRDSARKNGVHERLGRRKHIAIESDSQSAQCGCIDGDGCPSHGQRAGAGAQQHALQPES